MDNASEGITVAPNPFASLSTLHLTLASPAKVTLVVRDLLGREVLREDEGSLSAGSHAIMIDGSKLASQTYEYELRMGERQMTGNFTVVK